MFKRSHLTSSQRESLGKFPDVALAKLWGVSIQLVIRERNHLGLPPPRPWERIEWTEAMLARLGKESDARLAAEWGLTSVSVGGKRTALGIPVKKTKVKEILWTPMMIADLIILSLPGYKAKYGISEYRAQAERAIRGFTLWKSPANKTVWKPEMIERMGKEPDRVLSKRWRVGMSALRSKRFELGIPPYVQQHKKVLWTPEMVADLAILSVRAFTKKHRVHSRAVLIEREMRGIQARKWHRSRITKELRQHLGTMTDSAFAKQFGFTTAFVASTRVRLGITSFHGRQPVFLWLPDRIDCLGRFTDIALARRWGISENAVWTKRNALGIRSLHWRTVWTDEMRAVLQTMTCSAAAQHLGLNIHRIIEERRRLGLRAKRFYTPAEDALIGTMSDAKLGRKLGRHQLSVAGRRMYLGIARWGRTAPPSADQVLGAAEPAPTVDQPTHV